MVDMIRRYRKKFLGGSILSKGVKESVDQISVKKIDKIVVKLVNENIYFCFF